MPLDYSIPLQAEPFNSGNSLSRALTLKTLVQKGQLTDMELEGQMKLRDLFKANAGDLGKTKAALLGEGFYKEGLALDKSMRENDKLNFEAQAAKLKNIGTQLDIVSGLAGSVKSLPPHMKQSGWSNALARAKALGLEITDQPEQYPGDQAMDVLIVQSLKGKDYIDAQFKALNYDLERSKTKFETGYEGSPGAPVGTLGKPQPGMGARLEGMNPTMTPKDASAAAKDLVQKQGEQLVKDFDTLKNVPDQLYALNESKKAWEQASKSGMLGAGADYKLGAAKFWNNNVGQLLGVQIAPEAVENTEYLRSTMFRQIMENLKKLDAQPSQQQQKIMQESLGNIGTDPAAIPRIIDLTREIMLDRVKSHDARVRQAKQYGIPSVYDMEIGHRLPGDNYAPAPTGRSSLTKNPDGSYNYTPRK